MNSKKLTRTEFSSLLTFDVWHFGFVEASWFDKARKPGPKLEPVSK